MLLDEVAVASRAAAGGGSLAAGVARVRAERRHRREDRPAEQVRPLRRQRRRVDQASQVLGEGELRHLGVELCPDEQCAAQVGVGARDDRHGARDGPVGGVLQAQYQPLRRRQMLQHQPLDRRGSLAELEPVRWADQAGRVDEDEGGRAAPAEAHAQRLRLVLARRLESRILALDQRPQLLRPHLLLAAAAAAAPSDHTAAPSAASAPSSEPVSRDGARRGERLLKVPTRLASGVRHPPSLWGSV
mmetsp:Transcript_21630/g.70598  ORF Transcript_21630/g.70598 Transcript_21630/m.70598 type:complete len:245 (+) Transcript_21630:2047-2781(+)